jgi:DNA-binding NarL/FixJ family response regulator
VIRVYIVAASALARSGIANLLTGRGVSIIGSASSFEAVAEDLLDAESNAAPSAAPDRVSAAVILHLPDTTGDSTVEALAASHLAKEVTVAVLLDTLRAGLVSELVRAGVRVILPTQISREQLLLALQAGIAGLVVLDSAELSSLVPEPVLTSAGLAELTEPLTPREREVLQMLASGLANKEIAAKLSISEHTAKFHVASILGKLGAATRTEAVAIGIRRGLVLL